ncbi:GNAT family N-acetyltransferase [Collimonas sp. NPDC087041]|uniref:GNAT family N-acetyltransferase n=1 Tax=Collimonas sp. NPDC087041 TaxID=3363960 RepID=UPI0037F2DC44
MHEASAVIRLAKGGDSAAIQDLYLELTGDVRVHVLPEQIEAMHADPATHLLVCDVAGDIYGTALLSLCADAMYGKQPFATVENIIVASAARGAGLGRQLMASIEAICAGHDCSKIMLLSSSSRSDAHAFFASYGFSGDKKRGFVKYRSQFRTA